MVWDTLAHFYSTAMSGGGVVPWGSWRQGPKLIMAKRSLFSLKLQVVMCNIGLIPQAQ